MRRQRRADNTTLTDLLEGDRDPHGTPGGSVVDADAGPGAPEGGVRPEDAPTGEPHPDDGLLDDADYLPQQRRGPGRLTVGLVATLVLAAGVLGGIWVQKALGGGAAPGFPTGAAAPAGFPDGAGGTSDGGFPGASQQGGTVPLGSDQPGSQDAPGSRAGGSGTGGTASTPAVVGTVASVGDDSLVVTDLGGTKHTVSFGGSTTLTAPVDHGRLAKGDTVAVVGSDGAAGSVEATSITVT